MTNQKDYNEQLLDSIGESVLSIDRDYRIVSANKVFLEQVGMTRQEVIGEHCYSVRHGKQQPCFTEDVECPVKQVYATGKPASELQSYLRSDGTLVKEELRAYPLRDDDGKIIHVVEIGHDVTERLAMAESLNKKEEQFQSVAQTATDAIISINRKGQVIFWNLAAEKMFGFSSEEVLGQHLPPIMSSSMRTMHDEGMQHYLETGKERIIGSVHESLGLRKDGSEFPLEISIATWKTGDETCFTGIVRDVTTRKESENDLYRAKEIWEKTFDAIPDLIVVIDREHRVIDANKAVSQRLGVKRENIIGEPCYKVMHDSDEQPLYCPHAKSEIQRREIIEEIYEPKMRAHFLLSSTPLFNKNGEITATVEVARDITARKKMESTLARTINLESLGTLAGGIAHDFNNLLTAIIGNIELAKMFSDTESEVHRALSNTEEATHKARELARKLLTFSRGGLPVKKTGSISSLIKDTLPFLLSGSALQCEYKVPDKLWEVAIDTEQMKQVFNNIILNSREAMPDGGFLEVVAENVDIGTGAYLGLRHSSHLIKPGRYVKISIKDHGSGVPEEYLDKVFDPYFTTKERGAQKGTGLGLSICYSIIKNHSGYITIDPGTNQGVVITIFLPAAPIPMAQVRHEGKTATEKSESAKIEEKLKILVMEDEEMVAQVAEEMLAHLGYEAEVATNGDETLLKYGEAMEAGKPFSAVIMDLTIRGGMGGREAIGKLLALDPDAQALVCSGYDDDPVMANCDKFGFVGAITKPYNMENLRSAFDSMFFRP